ncbi:unnamed protein product [Ectocarpus sp. 8 AP-2014]
MYKGDERTRTLDISVDNLPYTTWTSSGATTGFETIEVDTMARWISIAGVLEDSEWLSIMEVEIMIDDGESGSDDGDTATTDAGDDDTTTNTSAVEVGSLGSVAVEASFYDPSLTIDGGCDPSGCVADNTRDGDLSTASRWSCAPKLGGECTISYDLGTVYDLNEARLGEGQPRKVLWCCLFVTGKRKDLAVYGCDIAVSSEHMCKQCEVLGAIVSPCSAACGRCSEPVIFVVPTTIQPCSKALRGR